MQLLGITPQINKIALWKNIKIADNEHQEQLQDVPIFREVQEGIDILVYTLDRFTIRIEKNNSNRKRISLLFAWKSQW